MIQAEEETRVEKWDREGGKSCGRGDDSLSLEKISRSNWTIVRSTGSRNFVLSSFVALGKRDGCSRFEKLFSTLKTGRERKENSIRYNKISTIIIIIIIKFHYLPYNMFQYRLIFILILKIIKTISFKITR